MLDTRKKVQKEFEFTTPSKSKEEALKEWEQYIIEDLMERFHFVTLSDTKEILYYDNRGYVDGGEDKIAVECEKLYPEVSSRRIQEIQGHIRRRTLKKRETFDKYPILNLKNGLLDLRTFRLCPHTPKYLSLIRCSVEYNPEAKCLEIQKFLNTTIHENDIEKILSLSSLVLERNTDFQVAGLFVGTGNNGKSVFLNLLNSLIGQGNISSVSLQELDSDRFASADLFGKILNICGDLPSKPINDTSIFKKIVGGDLIRAQRKFGHPFSFKPKTMLMFSTNKIPETPDTSSGFFRRWMIIPFPNNFDGKEDRNLTKKITTTKELSEFLNILIEHIKLRRRIGNLPGIENIEQREKTYNKIQNSIESFAEEQIERQIGNNESKDDVYESYFSYCKHNNIPQESKENFGKRFKQLGHKQARPTINGNRIYVWKDVSIVNNTQKG